jgi:hypothetical protein
MPTNICAYWSSSLCDMNIKQKGTESVISLLTAIILCIGRLRCNAGQELTIDKYLAVR